MYSQNKKFYFIGEVEGACLLANAEEKFLRPRREETRGPSLQEAWLPSHALLPSLLPQLLQHFSTSLLKKFHPMHKNSMSTFTGLVRLFSRRTTRVLSSKNVANTFQSSCRARSIFAATTRGASQNLIYAIPCACTKVCACEVHKYTQGWFYGNFCGVFSYFSRNHRALFGSLNSRQMLSRLTWKKMKMEEGGGGQ